MNEQNRTVVALIAVLLLCVGAVALIAPRVQIQMQKWRIEKDGIWIARYFPKDPMSVELQNIVSQIRTEENVVVSRSDWAVAPTNLFAGTSGGPLLYNTNVVAGQVLIVRSDQSIGWVKFPSDSK